MEPLAPGTEDDVHVAPAVSKKANEQERLLSIKTYLPSGEYSNVFELTYNNGSEHWYCKVCRCPIMGRVFYHEGGKRHTINMAMAVKPSRKAPGEAETEDAASADIENIKIAPGEPVPPGFEGEITKVAQIQERLDNFRSGSLLGLEYLLEIQDYDQEKEPSYLCLLCGKKGDPRTVIAHLVSYNHLQGYMQRHFPRTYQALAPYVTRQYKKNWQDTMNKIAEAIELKYGRLLPHPVEAEAFEGKRDELYQMIHMGPHFSEKNGVTFEDLVVKEEITKLQEEDLPEPITKKRSPSPPVVNKPKKPKPSQTSVRRRSLSSVSSISSSDLSDYEDGKKFKDSSRQTTNYHNRGSRFPPHRSRPRSRSRSRSPRRRRSPPLPPLSSQKSNANNNNSNNNRFGSGVGAGGYRTEKRESNMPWNRPNYMRPKPDGTKGNHRNDKLDEFRRLSAAIEGDMEKVLKQHKNNPEKHPQYNEEWKIFWNKRYKELQSEGKDASKYDFKPDWIVYWNSKIVDLHRGEVKAKVDALRRRLGIPVSDPTPISFKIQGKKDDVGDLRSMGGKAVPVASQPDQDHEVIVIEDNDDDSRSPRRSHSPWETEPTRAKATALTTRRISLDRISSDEKDLKDRKRSSKERVRPKYKEKSYERRDYRSKERDYRTIDKSWERDISYHRESRKDMLISDIYKPPPVMRDVTRNPVDYNNLQKSDTVDDGDDNIVAILRLLTALEDKLGSLGPKVVDMLATALAMEKKEANSSETLLDCEINCVLFETIKEKLKGQLHAGLVGYNQEKAFKVAIRKIASLIHLAGSRKIKNDAKPKVDPVKVPGVGTVDKAAIAKQIATALILQGKTDVTQAELEQLINAVVGMAEASKNAEKPLTTAAFLETLSKTETAAKPARQPKMTEVPDTSADDKDRNKDTMDGLSDSDLQTLLQNFKDLSPEEQHGLITYLKKMEAKEPERVEKLRKFVNLSEEQQQTSEPPIETGRISPFSRKLNPIDEYETGFEEDIKEGALVQEKPPKIESDDEEYSFEDVFKAANKNVEESKLVMERKIIEDTIKRDSKSEMDVLQDAKALIANIMGSINKTMTTSINNTATTSASQLAETIIKPEQQSLQNQALQQQQNVQQQPQQSLLQLQQLQQNLQQFQQQPLQNLQQPNFKQSQQNLPQSQQNLQQSQQNLQQSQPNSQQSQQNLQQQSQQNPQQHLQQPKQLQQIQTNQQNLAPPRGQFHNSANVVQYPLKNSNNSYSGSFQQNYGTYKFPPNQFNQNGRFQRGGFRGNFNNNNNSRW